MAGKTHIMNLFQRKNHHLLWRAGFGPAAIQLEHLQTLSHQQLYGQLKQGSAQPPRYLDATNEGLKTFASSLQADGLRQMADKETRRAFQQQTRKAVRHLNLLWLDEMVHSGAQLREKMAFFWHGHFAARNQNVFYQQQLLQTVRQQALGSFRDLLQAVSKSAAMLNFLNAQQNRKGHPNENFAREVMELFTLGRGHYSEADVKEAARAFTGWGANLQGEFVFRRFQHDGGTKTVLGKTGNLVGEDVLDLLLAQKSTARFITEKIYRFFVNESVNATHAEWLATRFYQNDYHIGKLLDDLFTADWFYAEKNMGARIKSPIELLVGMRRMVPMKIENEEAQLLLQKLLGQMLFYPPNVAGWPGGRTWIDSSTLMVRLRLPKLISEIEEFNIRPKDDDDQMMGRREEETMVAGLPKNRLAGAGQIRASVDWESFTKRFSAIPREQLVASLNAALLQVNPSFPESLIGQFADSRSRDAFVRTAALQVMSTPEYQLC